MECLRSDPADPHRYHVDTQITLVTPDLLGKEARWSRFLYGPYRPRKGFVDKEGRDFPIYLYVEQWDGRYQLMPDDPLARDLQNAVIPETCTAVHYYPGQCVLSIFTGLPLDTEEKMEHIHDMSMTL